MSYSLVLRHWHLPLCRLPVVTVSVHGRYGARGERPRRIGRVFLGETCLAESQDSYSLHNLLRSVATSWSTGRASRARVFIQHARLVDFDKDHTSKLLQQRVLAILERNRSCHAGVRSSTAEAATIILHALDPTISWENKFLALPDPHSHCMDDRRPDMQAARRSQTARLYDMVRREVDRARYWTARNISGIHYCTALHPAAQSDAIGSMYAAAGPAERKSRQVAGHEAAD